MLFKEKRREKRYSPDLTCTILPSTEQLKVLDVSVHGLSIVSRAQYSIGQELKINVELILVGYISVSVVVRNLSKIHGKNRYGLEITTIPEPWVSFVYHIMAQNEE